MSNHLAIATVTAALNQVLTEAVTADVTGGDLPSVTNVRPGGDGAETPATGVNVFLYSVTPNGHLGENDLPTRRTNGEPVQRPVLALDLHYLLTFYGDDNQFVTQRLLGSVVRTLHAAPTLPRAKIAEVSARPALLGSDLADAVQAVRFTPVGLSLEELSKLWSFMFQTPYALSAAYRATAVLIESAVTPRPALPVQTRTVVTVPFANPALERIESDQGPDAPILPTSTIVLRGRRLRGDVTHVRIGGTDVKPGSVANQNITLSLADVPPANLHAGVQGVSVVHQRFLGVPPQPHRGEESNTAALVLRPLIATSHYASGKLTVTVSPIVRTPQRAEALVNEHTAATALSFVGPKRDADTTALVFDAPGLPNGTYAVRVRVDGAESPPAELVIA